MIPKPDLTPMSTDSLLHELHRSRAAYHRHLHAGHDRAAVDEIHWRRAIMAELAARGQLAYWATPIPQTTQEQT